MIKRARASGSVRVAAPAPLAGQQIEEHSHYHDHGIAAAVRSTDIRIECH